MFILLALAGMRIWPHQKTASFILLILGIIALGTYVILNLSLLTKSFKRKSFIYSSNLFLVIILVLAILVIVNYFFDRHHYRFDFTESKLHSLSDQSIQVLINIKEDVLVKSFFTNGNFNRATLDNLIRIYKYHSKKIKHEFIDPDKNPGMVKRYEITEDGTTIFERGDKDYRITTVSEEDITNAIIQVTRLDKKIIYFLEGHGESSIEVTEESGYSSAKDELAKLGYDVRNLPLALADTFPEDVACLVIPGPEKDLLPNEVDTIRDYIQNGGRVLVMIDPENSPGMAPFLEEFGILLQEDLIIDTVSRLLGGDYFMPVVNEYEIHSITDRFRYATFFPYARSVEIAEQMPEGISAESLARSSSNSWSERQLDVTEVTFDEEKDKAGPVSLAVAVRVENKAMKEEMREAEDTSSEEKDDPKPEGRIVVYGDSDFVSNNYYYLSGNGNLFLNTINWLTEEEDLISIQAKTSKPRTIQLTPTQGRLLFFVSVLILPLFVIITGIVVWIRRRSL